MAWRMNVNNLDWNSDSIRKCADEYTQLTYVFYLCLSSQIDIKEPLKSESMN